MFFARLKLMSKQTENLNLYLTDMETDGNDTFNFDRDLNDNWKKIDNAVNNLSTDLNGKADTDLANAVPSQSFIEKSIGWGMPDFTTAINITSSIRSANGYKPNQYGKLYIVTSGNSAAEVNISNTKLPFNGEFAGISGGNNHSASIWLDAIPNVTYKMTGNNNVNIAYFYQLQGVSQNA